MVSVDVKHHDRKKERKKGGVFTSLKHPFLTKRTGNRLKNVCALYFTLIPTDGARKDDAL